MNRDGAAIRIPGQAASQLQGVPLSYPSFLRGGQPSKASPSICQDEAC